MTGTGPSPLGVRGIVVGALALYRRRFTTFAPLAVIAYSPFALLGAVLRSVAGGLVPGPSDTPEGGLFDVSASVPWGPELLGFSFERTRLVGPLELAAGSLVGALLLALAGLVAVIVFIGLVYPLAEASLIVGLSAQHLGEELSAVESLRRAFRRLGHLLVAETLATLATALGFVFFVVPGVFCLLWFVLVPPVALLEDLGALATLRRSRALMTGHLGRGILVGATVWLLGWLTGHAAGWVIELVPWPTAVAGFFAEGLVTGLCLPFQAGALVLFYYDLRVRKEGFGVAGAPTWASMTSK